MDINIYCWQGPDGVPGEDGLAGPRVSVTMSLEVMASAFGLKYMSRDSVNIILCAKCRPNCRIAALQGPAMRAKCHFLLALYTHSRPLITHIKSLRYVQRGFSCMLSVLFAGLWWPISRVCNTCKGPFRTCSLHSFQACDGLFQKPALCAKGHLLCTLCTRCRPMMIVIRDLQRM